MSTSDFQQSKAVPSIQLARLGVNEESTEWVVFREGEFVGYAALLPDYGSLVISPWDHLRGTPAVPSPEELRRLYEELIAAGYPAGEPARDDCAACLQDGMRCSMHSIPFPDGG